MFTQPAPPSTAGLLSPTTDAASSPSNVGTARSRLRGLSYLRSYTQTHLLSRDNSGVSAHSSSVSGAGVASGSPNSSASASATQHTPLTRATHSALSVTTGRRRARQSDDPLRDRNRKTTSAQNAQPGRDASQDSPERNSDSDSGRGKKHKTGTEEDRQNAVDESQDNQAESSSAAAADMARARSATTGDLSTEVLPSIRFSAHYDPRSTRQSLSFTPISRTLPTGKESIKVGRYSEREQQQIVPANIPSAAPVGFKSKVVSRRHCEFWHEDGKWYIKDVKSSSGTFLNHVRLSPPGNESKPFPVNDGDIVQLGIDFRGGEEMIFRAAADLDADVEEPDEEWQQLDSGGEDVNMDARETPEAPAGTPANDPIDAVQNNSADGAVEEVASQAPSAVEENGDVTMMLDHVPTASATVDQAPATSETSAPIPIPRPSVMSANSSSGLPDARRTPSPPNAGAIVHDGPLTPRNDAGPWVFDGDAGRSSQDVSRPGAMVNLDAAATRVQSNAS
ncbi:hypothetical protein E8E14_014052 [Neopestalotiopsis sp. 37M]|nr:hypothetical protein E8E14_014052 [Neopestalotiopsis sp. 37M]